jgi:hypothetical protein
MDYLIPGLIALFVIRIVVPIIIVIIVGNIINSKLAGT